MDKLKMHSLNKVDDNIAKIGQLFPNSLTERKNEKGEVEYAIDFDVLRQELSSVIVEGNEERYQFTWPDKKQSILLANAPIAKTLRPCLEESVDFDTTENLYIEGDNLDVLKLLQETYLGKVKMIYIDPPYNTGNDFVYEDDFAQNTDDYLANSGQYDEEGNRLVQNSESNGRFHTDWLNMIYPRLRVARDFLRDDGVIFVSCDDNEQVNLAKICDEVFGAINRIGPIIQNKQNAKNDTINIQKNHEFILVYRKNVQIDTGSCIVPSLIKKTVQYKDVFEENGKYYFLNDSITTRGLGGTLAARQNLGYTVYYNPNSLDKIAINDYDSTKAQTAQSIEEIYTDVTELLNRGYVPIRPPKVRGSLGCWTWSMEKFNEQKNNIVITGKPDSYAVKKRTFVKGENVMNIDGKLKYANCSENNIRSIWDYSTNDGTNALNAVLGKSNIFSNPKNLNMIMEILRIVQNKDSIILDFFSGSATTAHAVMQLNAEDGGNRKFIMMQLPELTDEKSETYKAGYKNICEIGKERIRRAGKKILEEQAAKDKSLFDEETPKLDIGFRVLKLDSTNMKEVYYNPSEYTPELFSSLTDNIKDDRTSEDLLFQVMLELGVLLSSKIEKTEINGKTVFNVADGYLIACFDDDINDATVKAIAQQKPYYAVFRDSSMASDSVATNVEQIFATYSSTTERKVI